MENLEFKPIRTSNVPNVYLDLNYSDTESTIHAEHVGTGADLSIKLNNSSGPRNTMYCGHAVQEIHTIGTEPRVCFTGLERKYAKHMFNIKVKEDCIVTRVINRTEFGTGGRILERAIFVKTISTQTLDVYVIPVSDSNHQHFGFEYKDILRVNQGMTLYKNTVLAECPSVIDREFCQGVMANVIFASDKDVIEDAVLTSTNLADKLLSYAYKVHRFHIGQKYIPLHLYGTDEEPRLFPSVGEKVRPDGVLFAQREFDEGLAGLELSAMSLREVDTRMDIPCIVDVNSEVIDVKVYRNHLNVCEGEDGGDNPHMKMSTMAYQQAELDRCSNGISAYHKAIRSYYNTIESETKSAMRQKSSELTLNISPELHAFFRDSIAECPFDIRDIGTQYAKNNFFNRELNEDYTVEITIKYPVPFEMSSKSTDLAGGKGVNGQNRPTELMPEDDWGVRVDIVMSDNAVLRRTNFNRPFEAYMGAAARDVRIDVLDMLDKGEYDVAWYYLTEFFNCASPEYYDKILEAYDTEQRQRDFLDSLYEKKIRIWFPLHTRKPTDIAERDVERNFPPRRSRLKIYNDDGSWQYTEKEFIIGEIYIMRLQQTGREFSAVAAAKFQAFGTIATPHAKDKVMSPCSEKPIKFAGNSETRYLGAYTGDDALFAEIHDLANNPMVQYEIIENIINAPEPTNIDEVIDREKYPLGNNRVMSFVDAIFECDGVKFTDRKGNLTL